MTTFSIIGIMKDKNDAYWIAKVTGVGKGNGIYAIPYTKKEIAFSMSLGVPFEKKPLINSNFSKVKRIITKPNKKGIANFNNLSEFATVPVDLNETPFLKRTIENGFKQNSISCKL